MLDTALLDAILACVRRDSGSPGFRGRVAIGLKGRTGPATWLVLTCGTRCEAEWTQAYPDHDAAMGLDEVAAKALLAGNAPPVGSLYLTTGDRDLLARFVNRYFADSAELSPLALRVQLARG